MIIGMYALQKRIIGIKNSIVIIVNNMSNTDADLNTILNILIRWEWNPKMIIVPVEISVIIFKLVFCRYFDIKKTKAEPARPPKIHKKMLSP